MQNALAKGGVRKDFRIRISVQHGGALIQLNLTALATQGAQDCKWLDEADQPICEGQIADLHDEEKVYRQMY